MRKLFILLSLTIAFASFSNNANAQTKKRIGLPEGADSVQIKGKISGKQYTLYEIWAEKGDEWSVKLNSSNPYIGYTVKAPNGDRYDFLENAQESGFYLIRVELNSKGAKSKSVANFTLDINFETAIGKPISE